MSPEMIGLIGATITGILSLAGVVLTIKASNEKMISKIETSQAVTDTKLQNLADEVKTLTDDVKNLSVTNSRFAERLPVLENRVDTLESTVKEIKNEINK